MSCSKSEQNDLASSIEVVVGLLLSILLFCDTLDDTSCQARDDRRP